MDMREVLKTPRLYMSYWASKRNVINPTDFDCVYLDHCEAITLYNLDNADKKPIKSIHKPLLEAAFNEYLKVIPIILRGKVADALQCSKEDLAPLSAWVKAVTGKLEDDDLYVMAHWLWIVKRNMLGLSVVHHIMPILTSPKQGGGKSTAVKRLIGPLEELSLELKMPQIVDERSFTMFSNYLIGFLDEMAGHDKIDLADFKRNVTSSSLTYRPMRTNTQAKIINLCAFIGASNSDIFEIIKDTTGIRRFFAMNALDKLDHEAINSIDYDALWCGINEKHERGYFEKVQVKVVEKQAEQAMKDEVALFVEDYSVIGQDTIAFNGKFLYQSYLMHCANSGLKFHVSAQTFYKKLRNMGIAAAKKPDKRNVQTWFFAINKDSPVATGTYRDN